MDVHRRRLAASLPLLVTALYLKPALADPSVHQASRNLMGTRLDITVQGSDRRALAAAADAAFATMAQLSDSLSRFNPTSRVNALHLMAGVRPLSVDPGLMSVLQQAQHLAQLSEGAFDITVGAYSQWNFEPGQFRLPTAAELTAEARLVDHRDLILDSRQGTAYLRRRGMRLDLGGIAKLPILEAGLQTLRRHGVRHAMLNGGGDVRVMGGLLGRPWRIGLRDPRSPSRMLGSVALSDGWVAASGDYERCFDRDGRHYHHILDPRTGWPTRGPHGITLVSRDLPDINGIGAAMMVAGSAWARSSLAARPGVDALIVDRNQSVWTSGGMPALLHA
ncbi:FAD:protein FMN transferase [Roseateles saccharophilus]|uniref:FAD:protein FMN transferase n=1 Tax=Roseateles saccharophilus TaxID=304 RepID=A0A4R3VEP4_ROSSA|nr:thiamine biosynthesis lipoprotein [Roseateles saccharophilus]